MQAQMIASVLHNVVALGALWYLIFCRWRTYRVDRIRDRLFQLRHELFGLAEQGVVGFEQEAYWRLRVQLNRMIARAHRMTGLVLLVKVPTNIEDPRSAWVGSIEDLPCGARDRLVAIERRMASTIFWHVVLGSPLSFVIALYRLITLPRQRHDQDDAQKIFVDAVSRSIEALPSDKEELVAVG